MWPDTFSDIFSNIFKRFFRKPMDKVNRVSNSNDNLGAIYEAKLTLVQVPVLFYSFYRLA